MSRVISIEGQVGQAGRAAGPLALALSFTREPAVKTMGAPEAVEDDAGLGDAAISEEVGHGGKYSTKLTWLGGLA